MTNSPIGMKQKMVIHFPLLLLLSASFATTVLAADAPPFFTESFDDGKLFERGWYDGEKIQISTEKPYAGAGSIEYFWKTKNGPPSSSSLRHLFPPTESVYLRFHIRLSKGW